MNFGTIRPASAQIKACRKKIKNLLTYNSINKKRMKKKFLNFALLGAVVLSSSVAFTGCKDYDEDIRDLQNQIDVVVSDLASLKDKVGEFVKSVNYNEATGVLTVVGQDGKTQTFKTHQEIPSYNIRLDGNTLYVNDVAQGSIAMPSYTVEIVGNQVVLKADGSIVSSAELPAGCACEDIDYTVEIVTDNDGSQFIVLKANGKEVSRTPLPSQVKYTAAIVGNAIVIYADGKEVSRSELQTPAEPSYELKIEGEKVVLYDGDKKVTEAALPSEPQYRVAIENGEIILYADSEVLSKTTLPANETTLTMGADGYIYVNNVKTDIKVPNTADHIQINDNGTVTLNIDGQSVTFFVIDAKPIYGVEFLPAYYTEYGAPAIVFDLYTYNPINEKNTTDLTISGDKYLSDTKYLPLEGSGVGEFTVNPLASSEEQLDKESFRLLEKDIAIIDTRAGKAIGVKYSSLKGGKLAVALDIPEEQAYRYINQKADGKRLAAIQFETKGGETIASEYVALAAKKNDKTIKIANPGVTPASATAHFSTTLAAAKALKAELNGTRDAVVLNVVNGNSLNLRDHVFACAGTGHETFPAEAYGMYYKFSSQIQGGYDIAGTNQQEFCTVTEDGVFTARTYNATGSSAIGRTPVVRIELRDSRNMVDGKDALVAVAFAKVLITDKTEKPIDPVEVEYPSANFTLNCNAMEVRTTVEWMNLNVYNKVELSKEEFYTLYELNQSASTLPVYKNVKVGELAQIDENDPAYGTDPTTTNMIRFTINENEVGDAGTYTAVAVYTKKVAGFANLPEKVSIKLSINVALPELKSLIRKDSYAWVDNAVISRGVNSSEGVKMYTDLNETFIMNEYLGQYNQTVRPDSYYFKIKQGETDGILDPNNASGSRIVLTTDLNEGQSVNVDVEFYVVYNSCLTLKAEEFKVRFTNPAKFDIVWTGKKLAMQDLLEGDKLDVAKSFKIIYTGTGETLYENGAATTLGKAILGNNPQVSFTKGTVTKGYDNNFTLSNSTLSWSHTEGNFVAEGKQVTCNINIKLTFGNETVGTTITNAAQCTITSQIPVKVYNPNDYKTLK